MRTIDKDHGRLEIRKHWIIDDLEQLTYLDQEGKWKGLRAIGMVVSERRIGFEGTTGHAITCSVLPGRCNALPPPFAVIGGLKTACIGCLTSLFGKMSRAFALDMPITIWRCSVTWL